MKFFRKIAGFFHSHPAIKSTAVAGLGAAASAAANGAFGPKAAIAAGALSALAGLWTKRPSDATVEDKAGVENPPKAE